jgi:P27 family predicted phage terminase small subunit
MPQPQVSHRAQVRGRRPKPTVLKVLAGNPGKRRLPTAEPVPAEPLGDPPEWMSEAQKEGWRYAIAHMPRGLLRSLDRGVFTTWVVAEAAHRQAAEAFAKYGPIRKKQDGELAPNPFELIMNRQAKIMLRAASELGFSPTSRARIGLHSGTQENPWRKFKTA